MLTYLTALKLKAQTALASRTSPTEASETEQGSGVVVVAIAALQALGVDIVGKLMQVANALS